jgi:hypothetical protein
MIAFVGVLGNTGRAGGALGGVKLFKSLIHSVGLGGYIPDFRNALIIVSFLKVCSRTQDRSLRKDLR